MAERRSARHALAEAVAVTASATVATAPLMASAFDQFSPAALPANVLAAPAVAPAMWLGMLTGIAGQAPFLPVEPLNWLDSLCLAYIAQVAHWLAAPDWALLTVHLGSVWSVAAAYAGLLLAMELLLRWMPGRLVPRPDGRSLRRMIAGPPWSCSSVWRCGGHSASGARPPSAGGLVVRVLDVGQGDSILLQPADSNPILVDTGPPGDGVKADLASWASAGWPRIVITHDQSDHAGDLAELLGSVRVDRVVYGRDGPDLRGAALGAGVEPYRLAEGGEIDSGALQLTALWPPRELLGETE